MGKYIVVLFERLRDRHFYPCNIIFFPSHVTVKSTTMHTSSKRQKPAKYETQKIREIDYWLYMPATV